MWIATKKTMGFGEALPKAHVNALYTAKWKRNIKSGQLWIWGSISFSLGFEPLATQRRVFPSMLPYEIRFWPKVVKFILSGFGRQYIVNFEGGARRKNDFSFKAL